MAIATEIGQSTIDPATTFGGTTIGGLSGLTFDGSNFYAISDARNNGDGPVRFYTLNIDLNSATLPVTFTGVTLLKDSGGNQFAANVTDIEGIAYTSGNVFVSSEGMVSTNTPQFITQFNLTGNQNFSLPISSPRYDVSADTTNGIRDNRGFESLSITPDQKYLFTATEVALEQDSNSTTGSPSRILKYNLTTNSVEAEFVYTSDAGNGISELLALDENTLLALDRNVSNGVANLYQISLSGATDIKNNSGLIASGLGGITQAQKTLAIDLTNFPLGANFEGMSLGPTLSSGKRSLILVTDNNFGAGFGIPTGFVAYEINSAPVLDNTGLPTLTAINEDDINNTGTLVSNIIASGASGNPITDSDPSDPEGIAVTAVGNTNGTWQFSTDGGSNWTAFGTPSESAARLLASDANTRIRFIPNADYNGTVNPAITFRAWDGTTGTNGNTADITTSGTGGLFSFSTANETASIIVNPVNDAPTFTPGASQAVNAGAGVQTVSGWATGFNPGPANESSQAISNFLVNVTSNPGIFATAPTIDASGKLTYTPVASIASSTTATVEVRVRDNGGTANGGQDTSVAQIFTITVNPVSATPPLSVVINEVAWMGTQVNTFDEWIELFNPTGSAIDLSNWTLKSNDNNVNITIPAGKTIAAGGYFLLERTDDNTVSDISADLIYTGALVNAGESLTLKDSNGNVVDTANIDGGVWPGGVNFSANARFTMERISATSADTDSNWRTNDGITQNGKDAGGNIIHGTPRSVNSPGAIPTLSIDNVNVNETDSGTTKATFTVTLSNANSQTISVDYLTADSTVISPNDYTVAKGTVTFLPGETQQSVIVPVVGDTLNESNENFYVNLSNPSKATIAISKGQGTIIDNDPLPSLSIGNVTITEGDSGTSNATFKVSLAAASGQTVSVDYITTNGTASNTSDYTGSNGTVTFKAGETTRNIIIPIVGDTVNESQENFFVTLSNSSNANIAVAKAEGTITDNDPLPSLSIGNVTITEGDSGTNNAIFTVSLSAASGQTVAVDYITTNGTATDPSDYTANNGTLTFKAGETTQNITIPVVGDTVNEAQENFYVNLSNPNNATIAVAKGEATITDNDAVNNPPVNNVPGIQTTNEDTTLVFNVANGNLIAIADPDAGSNSVQVTLNTSNGTLNLASVNGLTFSSGSNGTASITFGGTISDINTALNGTIFTPVANYNGAANIQIITNDGGNTGTGGALSDTDTININVNSVNDAPIVASPIPNQTATATTPFNFTFATNTFSDVDTGDTLSYTATLFNGDPLPTWLSFDPITRTFSGTPTDNNVGTLRLQLTATDSSSASISNLFDLVVNNSLPVTPPTPPTPPTPATPPIPPTPSIPPTPPTPPSPTSPPPFIGNDLPQVSITDATVTEGNNGVTLANFTINLNAIPYQAVIVEYATADGTATTANKDYNSYPATAITFNPGEVSKTISVALLGDSNQEGDETFFVNLIGVGNAAIADGQGVGTINNDDVEEVEDCFCQQIVHPKPDNLFAEGKREYLLTLINPISEIRIGTESHDNNFEGRDEDDALYALDGDDLVLGKAGNDNLVGDKGKDTVFGGNDRDWIAGNEDDDVINGNDGKDLINGNQNNDLIRGGKGDDIIRGGQDSDLIWGDRDDDILLGDKGDDRIFGGVKELEVGDPNGRDLLLGGSGNDMLNGNEGSDTVCGDEGNDTVRGGNDDDIVIGDVGNDELFGDLGNDSLCGGDGDDTIYAGNGSNIPIGSVGAKDCLCGGNGNDLLFGNEGEDWINGDDGDDTIYGGKDNDTIKGGNGKDWLIGDLGNDLLKGGNESDRFLLSPDFGTDTILDFEDNIDLLVLSGNLNFSQLTISQSSNGTAIGITKTGEIIAFLQGLNFYQIDRQDFVSIEQI